MRAGKKRPGTSALCQNTALLFFSLSPALSVSYLPAVESELCWESGSSWDPGAHYRNYKRVQQQSLLAFGGGGSTVM
jgi:hypothetical protein